MDNCGARLSSVRQSASDRSGPGGGYPEVVADFPIVSFKVQQVCLPNY
jgi:hypothetical protein